MEQKVQNKVIIYGAGSPTTVKLIDAINRAKPSWDILGYLVDKEFQPGSHAHGYPVLGGREIIPTLLDENTYFINDICSTALARRLTCDVLDDNNCQLATLIHPNVDTSYTTIEPGCMIAESVIFGANVTIGRHCAIRSHTVISHDAVISDYSIISASVSLSGHVYVEPQAFIGAGSTIKERKTIGRESVVGAGAVVIHDVRPNTTVVGVPAKELIQKSPNLHEGVAD